MSVSFCIVCSPPSLCFVCVLSHLPPPPLHKQTTPHRFRCDRHHGGCGSKTWRVSPVPGEAKRGHFQTHHPQTGRALPVVCVRGGHESSRCHGVCDVEAQWVSSGTSHWNGHCVGFGPPPMPRRRKAAAQPTLRARVGAGRARRLVGACVVSLRERKKRRS